jgi:hypothetical protein
MAGRCKLETGDCPECLAENYSEAIVLVLVLLVLGLPANFEDEDDDENEGESKTCASGQTLRRR